VIPGVDRDGAAGRWWFGRAPPARLGCGASACVLARDGEHGMKA
jgi:hypothetical protein